MQCPANSKTEHHAGRWHEIKSLQKRNLSNLDRQVTGLFRFVLNLKQGKNKQINK